MLKVLYENSDFIAVAKPPGLPTHRSSLHPQDKQSVLSIAKKQWGQKLYAAHRLDRATSGLLFLAKNGEFAAKLGAAFQERKVQKQYLAIVRGWLNQPVEIDHPLSRRGELADQEAMTKVEPVFQFRLPYAIDHFPEARYTCVLASPLTGRQHQIRRHLKHINHPIIGDSKYGKGSHNRLFRSLNMPGLMLHSYRAKLPLEALDWIVCPPPEAMVHLQRQFAPEVKI